jgi:hypothetical protein
MVKTMLRMFRKGLIRPGCLIKCIKTASCGMFLKGRPYRVLWIENKGMWLKCEGGNLLFLPTMSDLRSKKAINPLWTSFSTFKS